MKFSRNVCPNGKPVWDSERTEQEFLRITMNLNGQYVLYHCYGRERNGITPLRSELIARMNTLNECKKRAREIYDPQESKKEYITARDYSHVRLPYKD